MASPPPNPPKRRRRLLYMEKGSTFNVPKSTLSRVKREAAIEGGTASEDPGPCEAAFGPGVQEEPSDDLPDVPEELPAELGAPDPSEDSPSSGSDAESHFEWSDTDPQETSLQDMEANPANRASSAQAGATSSEVLTSALRDLGAGILPHSTTTKAEAVALVMAFLVSGGSTWTDLDNLLLVINTLFAPAENVLPRSKYFFRKLWAAKAKSVAVFHFYCKQCNDLMMEQAGSKKLACRTCGQQGTKQQLKNEGSFFVIFKMHEQLEHVIMKTKHLLHDALQRVASPADSISDITEGQAYRDLRASANLKSDDLTLTVNTDGSPVFSSSGASVWPIQFLVNEVPVDDRFHHCTVAGLWFGKGHPSMTLFLEQFVEEMNNMIPVVWEHEGITHTSQAYVVCWCLDAPARAAVQNCILYNGYIGCPWCLTRGEYLDGSLRYVNLRDTAPRTSAGVLRDMEIALSLGGTIPINGYYGPSPAVNLPHFNLVWGFTVEYMHAVLLGVVKQVTEVQLSSSNSDERYYVGGTAGLTSISGRLEEIRPPHSFTRFPRPLSTRSHWKASEWCHWLLFYWLPCMFGVLPEQYWLHVKKLVEAVHILLNRTITSAAVDRAETMLRSFVSMTGTLYGASAMTFNVHQLLHLPEAARQMGPLWGHSAFVFEGGNGRLVKLVKGASAVPQQIVERVVMAQQLEHSLASPLLRDSVKTLCNNMLGYPQLQNCLHESGVSLLGYSRRASLNNEERSCLSAGSGSSCDEAVEYYRFVYKGQIFHSRSYSRARRSDSSVAETQDSHYVAIMRVLSLRGDIVLLCRKIVITHAGPFPGHIQPCFVSQVGLQALHPQQLKAPCLFIRFRAPAASYVCNLPNLIERD